MNKPLRRELVLLAGKFDSDKHDPVGMLMSEKLDGNRCWWDGGVSRGVPTVDVPWASIYENDGVTLKAKIKPVATGLWSRYGNPVQAPEWFLDAMPKNVSLDGELYAGHGKFQYVQSAVRKDVPVDSDWKGIAFHAFGAPTFAQVLQDGLIKMSGSVVYHRTIDQVECLNFVASRMTTGLLTDMERALRDQASLTFIDELDKIAEVCLHNGSDLCVPVPHTVCESVGQVLTLAQKVSDEGGEGTMLRDPDSIWMPKRKNFILKVKPRSDSTATIVGFVAGRSGKTGLIQGMLGTLVVHWNGDENETCGILDEPIEFEIGTGLTFADRELKCSADIELANAHPGKPLAVPNTAKFKLGDTIEFSYRELSDGGTPKEASYHRVLDLQ